jgi:hypothetical protein
MSVLQSLNVQAIDDDEIDALNGTSVRRIDSPIDLHPFRAFTILTVFYFVVVLSLSSLKLLWLDELITLHIARLRGAVAIWQALGHGVDPNPPLSHLLVHYSRSIFGEHEFALRLPAMIGYWAGMLTLFLYLKRRLSPTWAVAGTITLMAMGAFEYSYESRSYGIFFGLAMVAFYLWSRAADATSKSSSRRGAIVGMALALAAGISTNYFAVVAFLPICIGESVRTFVRARESAQSRQEERHSWPQIIFGKSIDYAVWIGIFLAAMPFLAYRPMIEHSIAQFAPYAWNKVSLGQVADSYTEMVEVILYPIVGLFVLGILIYFSRELISRLCGDCRAKAIPRLVAPVLIEPLRKVKIPWHEAAAVGAFTTYPLLGYVIASVRGGMLSPRFVIPVCFGFAIAATVVAFHLFANFSRAGLAVLIFVSLWFICRESYVGYWYEEQKECFYKVIDRIPQADSFVPPGAPIVIPDPLFALTFAHYAPAQLASRAIFPVDFPAIRFYRHDDSPEENLWAGRKILYHLPIEPVANFENSAGRYLIIASDGNWLLEDLHNHHYDAYRLTIDTRAQAIGGFTPLAHGTPSFYVSDGPATQPDDDAELQPFKAADELPTSKALVPDGAF